MAELVANCPRCGANRIKFDMRGVISTHQKHGWQVWYESFCVCRQCLRSTVFILAESADGDYAYVHKKGLLNIDKAVNKYVKIEGYISPKDTLAVETPDFVPENIGAIFREGATCLATNCYNAAGTMSRLCVDLATVRMLPEENGDGLNAHTRRNLGLRLPWMFDKGILPDSLRDLAGCIREDGNDAAHAGTLRKADAEDLLDFAVVLLERLFTEPERLRLANERRAKRRTKNDT